MTTLEIVDRWEGGISWTLAEEVGGMHRTSHALETEAGIWVIDPVDAPGLDDELAALGDVAGVTLLLDRHKRDAAAVAERHDVPVSIPESMFDVADDIDAETDIYSRVLPRTEFRTISVLDNRLWTEVALHDPGRGTLVVPEAVGTAEFFTTDVERLGVHPALRLFPPREALGGVSPDRIVVGHGPGVFDDAANALWVALARSRKSAPKYYAGLAMSAIK